ncbi:hypothetical protein ABK040_010046 [Willaertia magna]
MQGSEQHSNALVAKVMKKFPKKKELRPTRFYDYIKRVKILADIQHDSRSTIETKSEDDINSFFFERIRYWDELNKTIQYRNFRDEIFQYIRTLPEMIHFKEKIRDIFCEHLKKDSPAIEPISDLITVFAKDLRYEFYSLFPKIFFRLVRCINPRTIQIDAHLFKCIAFLFKYLQKYILENFDFWYKKYSALLGHNKWFIRKFAAESFSFLINKLPKNQLEIYVKKIFNALAEKQDENLFDGTSQMFFEAMRGILGNFHSKMPQLLPVLLKQLEWNFDSKFTFDEQLSFIGKNYLLLEKCFTLMRDHARTKDIIKPVWEMLVDQVQTSIINFNKRNSSVSKEGVEEVSIQFGHLIYLSRVLITEERCDEQSMRKIIELINSKALFASIHERAAKFILEYILTMIEKLKLVQIIEDNATVLLYTLEIKNRDVVYTFFKKLMGFINMEDEDSKIMIEFFKLVNTDIETNFDSSLAFLVNFVLATTKDKRKLEDIILFGKSKANFIRLIYMKFVESIENLNKMERTDFISIWSMLFILSRYGLKSNNYYSDVYKVVLKFINNTMDLLSKNEITKDKKKVICSALAQSLSLIITIHTKVENCDIQQLFDAVLEMLSKYGKSLDILIAVDNFLDRIDQSLLTKERLVNIVEHLKESLLSKSDNKRLVTLRILSRFKQFSFSVNTEKRIETVECNLFQILRDSEECGIDFFTARNREVLLNSAATLLKRHANNIHPIYWSALTHYVFGGYYIKFQPLWQHIGVLSSLAVNNNLEEYWSLCTHMFAKALFNYHGIKDITYKSFVYHKKKRSIGIPLVKFNTYEKDQKIEKFSSLEATYLEFEKDETKVHTDYNTYLNLVLNNFFGTASKCSHPQTDIINVFRIFYEVELKTYDKGGLIYIPNSVTKRLQAFLGTISEFDASFFTEENDDTIWLKDLLMRLFSTLSAQIQTLVLKCIYRYQLPYLPRKVYTTLQKSINEARDANSITKIDFETDLVPKEYKKEYLTFTLKIIEPYLLKIALPKKKGKAGRIKKEKTWKRRVSTILEHVGKQSMDVVTFVMDYFLSRFKENGKYSIELMKSSPAQTRWFFDVAQEIIYSLEPIYGNFFETLLDFTLTAFETGTEVEVIEMVEKDSIDEDPMDESNDEVEEEEQEGEETNEQEGEEEEEGNAEEVMFGYEEERSANRLRKLYERAIGFLTQFFSRQKYYSIKKESTDRIVAVFNTLLTEVGKHSGLLKQFPLYFSIYEIWFSSPELLYLVKAYEKELLLGMIGLVGKGSITNNVFKKISTLISSICKNRTLTFVNNNKHFDFIKSNDDEMVDEDDEDHTIGSTIFVPNTVNSILTAYYAFRNSKIEIPYYTKSCFKLVNQIRGYFDASSPAEIILDFYSDNIRHEMNDEETRILLSLAKTYLSYTSKEIQENYIVHFSKMFYKIKDNIIRRTLCEILDDTAQRSNNPNLKYTSEIVHGLNANEESHLVNVDTDSFIKCCDKLIQKEETLRKLNELEMYPIIGNLLFFLGKKEWLLSSNASKSLISLIDIIVESKFEFPNIRSLLVDFIQKLAVSAQLLQSNTYMKIFVKMIDTMDELKELRPLSVSLSYLAEDNTAKKYEGIKKIYEIVNPIENSPISQTTISTFVFKIIYEFMGSKDNKSRELAINMAVYLIISMKWEHVKVLLDTLVTMLGNFSYKLLSKRKTAVLEILSKISDQFSFSGNNQYGSYNEAEEEEEIEMIKERYEEEEEKPDEDEMVDEDSPYVIRNYFVFTLMPKIKTFLWDKKQDVYLIRMNVFTLISKILKKCNRFRYNTFVNQTITEIVSKLKSGDEEQLNTARDALMSALQEVGDRFFLNILRSLTTTLSEDGYQAETLYITLTRLLQTLAGMKKINITKSITELMNVLLKEITLPPMKTEKKRKVLRYDTSKSDELEAGGDTSQKKYFQLKLQNTLFLCIERLGVIINIEKDLGFVVNCINDRLKKVVNSDILQRFEYLFKHLLKGLKLNGGLKEKPSLDHIIDSLKLYRIQKKTFKTSSEIEEDRYQLSKPKNNKLEENFLIQKEPGRVGVISEYDESKMKLLAGLIENTHIIVQFYLKLFETFIKRSKVKLDECTEEMENVIPLLIKYIGGKQLNVALISLRILIECVKKYPKKFEMIEDRKNDILNNTFELMLNTGLDATNTETWDTLLISVKYFLHAKYTITSGQIDVLLDMLKIELNSTKKLYTVQTFEILSILIKKKIQAPQIYDIMERVKMIMIGSFDEKIQNCCVNMLVDFYLNYPFTNEALQEKLNYLFKNVLNENMTPTSKGSILSVIQTIIKLFPNPFLNEKCELIYLPLILELEKQCKLRASSNNNNALLLSIAKLRETIRDLLKCLNDENFSKFIQTALTWMKTKKLRPVGVNAVITLAMLGNGTKLRQSQEFNQVFLPEVIEISKSAEELENYPSLVFETIELLHLLLNHGLVRISVFDEIWETLLTIISNTETYKDSMRLESLKLLDLYLSKRKKSNESNALSNADSLKQIGIGIVKLLHTTNLSEEHVVTVVRMFSYIFGYADNLEEKKVVADELFMELRNLFKKLVYDTDDAVVERRIAIIKLCVGVCSTHKEKLAPYLVHLCHLFYEVDQPNSITSNSLSRLNNEAKQLVQSLVCPNDVTSFNEAYQQAQKEITKRIEGKQAKKQQSEIVNPISRAKSRLLNNMKRNKSTKRKMKEKQAPDVISVVTAKKTKM